MNFYDDNGLVICQICGFSFNKINGMHLRKHNIKLSEYQSKYKNAPLSKYVDNDNDVNTNLNNNEPIIESLNFKLTEDNNNIFDEDKNEIKELSKIKLKVIEDDKTPMYHKNKILNYLKNKYKNIQNNYMVKIHSKSNFNIIEYEFITDMADPVKKIIFDFPNSFWHNEQIGMNKIVKNKKLKSIGWKIITINEKMPRIKHIIKY